MSQKEGKFQSKSGKFGGGGKGKGRPGGGGFGKKFEGDRGGYKGGGKRFEGRGSRDAGSSERREYKPRSEGGEGGSKPYQKREYKPRFEGGGGGGKPYQKREYKPRFEGGEGGDKPYQKREYKPRFEGGGGDRPYKKPFRDRDGGGDRGGYKGRDDRGGGFKGRDDRGGGRSFGDRKPYQKKPWGDRAEGGGDRPFKKPFRERDDRPRSFEGGESRGERPEGGGDRPFKKPFREREGGGGGFKSREGGGYKGRDDRGGGGFKSREGNSFKGRDDQKSDYRARGDRHKPYKRFDDGPKRKPFRVDREPREELSDFDTPLAEVGEVTPFEATPETRQKLKSDRPGYGAPSSAYVYGVHAVRAAIQNPRRIMQRLLVTEKGFESISEAYDAARNAGIKVPEATYVDSYDIERLLPRDAVHQGILLDAQPPEEMFLADILLTASEHAKILVLDQVTDPHNVGAIMRSAAAFGAIAVVVQKLHAPDITGTLAKSASGAVEVVPMVKEVNLTRALEQLKEAGFFCIGLAEEGKENLAVLAPTGKVALVLGAEGEGLRRLVSETCDTLAKLPTSGPISSLNVSNAAAVALYELTRNS
ncbi:MAG: 23S rRNA (guanosine(2251)-2'-O)-methyltransferase RlmB [Alphaproteobacteria bacterium]